MEMHCALTKHKFLDWTKLKALSDDKFYRAKIMISVYDRVENNVKNGENAGYQHFLLFPNKVFKGFLSQSC